MYDVIVIGAGLSGLLAALMVRRHGLSTAVVASGVGKLAQSTGLMDEIPVSIDEPGKTSDAAKDKKHKDVSKAVDEFKKMVSELGYPYHGESSRPVSVVTGSGLLKETSLYPETVAPVPQSGHALVVGFEELADFQPSFLKANLRRQRSKLRVDAIRIRLGYNSQRVMTQLDAAYLMDSEKVRDACIKRIREQLTAKQIGTPDFYIFPAALGMRHWREAFNHFSTELNAKITEAPGLPPNATAIRLNNLLRREASRCGVRFYENVIASGGEMDGGLLQTLRIDSSYRVEYLAGRQFILATGGIMGGGLEVTNNGFKETALHLNTSSSGTLIAPPENVYPAGAAQIPQSLSRPIVSGVYTIWSTLNASDQVICALKEADKGGVINV